MKASTVRIALAIACGLSMSAVGIASGGHGGGHSSGGHASGGHTSGGHGGAAHGRPGSHHAHAPAHGGSRTATPRSGGASVRTAVPRAGGGASHVVHATVSPTRPGHAFRSGLGFGRFGLYGLYSDPFWLGYGYASGLPGYSAYGYAPDPLDTRGPTGGLRLQVEPKEAEVFVDGYYAGIVGDFDGHFQHLDLTPGPHHIEIVAAGRQPLAFDVSIQAHRKIEYRGALLPATP